MTRTAYLAQLSRNVGKVYGTCQDCGSVTFLQSSLDAYYTVCNGLGTHTVHIAKR